MSLSTMDNILGKHMFPNFLSSNHILYFPEAVGVITSGGMQQPNINEYERKGWGVDGIAYSEHSFKDQPWSMEVEYNESFNRFIAIMLDQNPSEAEKEDETGIDVIGSGGSISQTKTIDIIINQRNRENTKFVKSLCFLNSSKNKMPVDIPNEGSSKVSLSGVAKRGYQFNKPAFIDGWGHMIKVSPADTPDDTISLSDGSLWLRRTSGTDWTSRKAFYKGGIPLSSGDLSIVSSDAKYSSVLAYETSKDGYSDIAFTILDGTEDSSPTIPSDSECETHIDSISSGARWCRIADLYIDETSSVIIDTVDIKRPNLPSNTFSFAKTAAKLSDTIKTDPFFILDYAIYVKINGIYKSNSNNITSESETEIQFGSEISDMVEVVYLTQPTTIYNPLEE